jgi:hypothetical protein
MIRVASLVSFNQPLVGLGNHLRGFDAGSVPPQRSHCSISIPNTRFKALCPGHGDGARGIAPLPVTRLESAKASDA